MGPVHPRIFVAVFLAEQRKRDFPSYRYRPRDFLAALEVADRADEELRIREIHAEAASAYDASLIARRSNGAGRYDLSQVVGAAAGAWLARHGMD